MSLRTSKRSGISNNRFMLLLVLAVVGMVLHYSGKPNPWASLKHDVLGIFGVKTTEPKKTRPRSDDTGATDTRPDDSATPGGGNATRTGKTTDLEAYLPAHGDRDQVVRHNGFILQYDEDYEQARWVLHEVIGKAGKAKRSDRFMPDPLVKTRSALPSDYARSGYDRGHMAPAGDFKYDQALTIETFYMSNMSPQSHELNIGIWNDIEAKIRTWSKKYGPLVVLTGPVLKPGLPTIGQSTQVAVPEQYFKIVYDANRQKAIAFLVENRGYTNTRMSDLTVSIDDVERATGVNFFAALPDSVEKVVEAQREVSEWF